MSNCLVVLPTYNERINVEKMLNAIMSLPSMFDVVVVDDDSPDGTHKVVQECAARYPERIWLERRIGKRGLGTAYLHGFAWGLKQDYDFIFEIDCDFSHPPDQLETLLAACQNEGFDISIGSRYVPGGSVANWHWQRRLLSRAANRYVRLVTGIGVCDATAGFKCYRAEVLRHILRDTPLFVGYGFQIEMKFRARKYGYRLKEIPITFVDRVDGSSKLGAGTITEALFGVIRLRVGSLFRSWEH